MKKIFFVILVVVISVFVYVNVNADVVIPDEAIRVRVVPNSNSVLDQNMKDMVREYVSGYMYLKLNGVYDVEVARDIIDDSIEDIEVGIRDLFLSNDYDMDFSISFGNNYFPNKNYKGVLYNEGEYESLVVYIGEAKGDNWWCVLFPPLCLLEAEESSTGEVEYKSFVSEMIERIF